MANDQALEDAMVVIQEASAAITQVSTNLSSLRNDNEQVVAALKALTEKVSKLENIQTNSAEPAKVATKPPLYVRSLVRVVYRDFLQSGSHQFILTESYSGANNQKVVDAIKQEVLVRHSSAKEENIEAACCRYYQSLYQDHVRETNGKKDKHRRDQRRFARKKQKLLNRRRQFQNGNFGWSSTRMERMKYILSKGLSYVSSEESGDEDGKQVYFRRYIPWLKTKYRKSLRQLDNMHCASLTGKSKQMYRTRCDGEPSTKSPPPDVPDYLLSESGVDLNSSVSSNN